MIDFSKFTFLYNADAHFKALDRFPDGFFQTLIQENKTGFDALCWGLAELSMQGELVRRYQGQDPKEYLTEDKVRALLDYTQTPDALKVLIQAINLGIRGSSEEDEEIDEVLYELQKKRTNE